MTSPTFVLSARPCSAPARWNEVLRMPVKTVLPRWMALRCYTELEDGCVEMPLQRAQSLHPVLQHTASRGEVHKWRDKCGLPPRDIAAIAAQRLACLHCIHVSWIALRKDMDWNTIGKYHVLSQHTWSRAVRNMNAHTITHIIQNCVPDILSLHNENTRVTVF